MRIRYLSDLHLEFLSPNQMGGLLRKITPAPGCRDVCVLAGDIGIPRKNVNYHSLMRFANKHFRRTFVITGNHEYYNDEDECGIDATNSYLSGYFSQFDNVKLLNNSYEHFDDHCFVGTTLWSRITNPRCSISDVDRIPNFDWKEYNRRHQLGVSFLKDTINNHPDGNCVVITHHAPSFELTNAKYRTPRMAPYHQWFSCDDMDGFIAASSPKIKCWIYGHTHAANQTRLFGVDFFCNPVGYPGENEHRNDDELFRTIVLE